MPNVHFIEQPTATA